ncbi:MAG: YbhB/YbcL family Raf kinase inhibitor-like protein [Halothermotrichaceae bacterium]
MLRAIIIGLCVFITLIIAFVIYKKITNISDYVKPEVNLKITSNAFKDGGKIPVKYTGRGKDVSPQLQLDTIVPEAQTIAIIMDDLDHPLGVYNHWVIWNIPAVFDIIPEGVAKGETVSSLKNAVQGKSGYGGKHYYRGPKPPFNLSHKYVFKVYVLDAALELDNDAGKPELQKAMKGRIIQFGTLTGVFN